MLKLTNFFLFVFFFLLLNSFFVFSIPKGFTTYFLSDQGCPDGWSSLKSTQGRVIVSVISGDYAGVTVGDALTDQQSPTHEHNWSTTVNFAQHDVSAIGCCNDEGLTHGTYPINGTTQASESGYPFTQLLFCHYDGQDDDSIQIPYGTVAYFDTSISTCPKGFQPFTESNGRTLISSYSESGTIPSPGEPLSSGEDRPHNHVFETNFNATDISYAGIGGCCNEGPANSGKVVVAGTTDMSSSNIPYMQLLTCLSENQTFSSDLPSSAALFNAVKCPPGYSLLDPVSGRFLVSLPDPGTPGASFGGKSLSANGKSQPENNHIFTGVVPAPPVAGVGLAAGCCASGYAGHQNYPFNGITADNTVTFPYLMLPLCVPS